MKPTSLHSSDKFMEVSTVETKNTLSLLTGVVLCEEGKTNEGKEILSDVLPNLNFELTKQIVLNYTL